MKHDLNYKLDHRKIRPCPRFATFLSRVLANISNHSKIKYDFDYKKYKGKQILVIADHAARNSYYGTIKAIKYHRLNFVTGYHNFFYSGLFNGFVWAGNVPKYLYQPDLRATKDILKLVKMGANMAVFIEGIQSTSGSTHPINPATIKFIKKLNLPIILVSSRGSYLANPRFSKEKRKGYVEYVVREVCDEKEILSISDEELYAKILSMFKYNDFEWNKEHKHTYSARIPLASGIDSIIYHCPKCHKEFKMKVDGDVIECECGNRIKLTNTYELVPIDNSYLPYSSIDDWYKDERKKVQEEIKNENLSYSFDVEMYDLYTDKLRKNPEHFIGKGNMTISKDGIRYVGKFNGKDVDILYSIKGLPSVPFTPAYGFDFYYDNYFYSVKILDEPIKAVKYMLLIEEWHNLVDEKWNQASRDVYD